LEILHVPFEVEGFLVFEDIEGLHTHGLCNIDLRILLRESLGDKAIECLFCFGRIIGLELVVDYFQERGP
jgi:hypothetical protein